MLYWKKKSISIPFAIVSCDTPATLAISFAVLYSGRFDFSDFWKVFFLSSSFSFALSAITGFNLKASLALSCAGRLLYFFIKKFGKILRSCQLSGAGSWIIFLKKLHWKNKNAYSLDSVTQYLFGTQEYLYTKSEMLTTYRTGSVTQYQNCTSRITLYISGAHREDKTHSNLSRFALRFLSPRAGEPLTLFYNSSLKKINFLDFTWSSCSFLDS